MGHHTQAGSICGIRLQKGGWGSVTSMREATTHTFFVSTPLVAEARHGVSQSRLVRCVPETHSSVAGRFAPPDGSRTGAVSVAALRGTARTITARAGEVCGRTLARCCVRHEFDNRGECRCAFAQAEAG